MSNPWFSIFSKGGAPARFRLFCFPFAGGGSAFYRTWPNHLPESIEVLAVRPPGRETRLREQPHTSMTALVAATAEALRPLLHLPFAFFGHSMGGLLAYELACHLREQGLPRPVHLFVSGYRAPHRPAHHPPVHQAGTPAILNRLRSLNGTPAAFFDNAELVQMMLPGIQADFSVLETYVFRPAEALDCPISAFGGYLDSEASEADILAWQSYSSRAFTKRMLPGGHFFIASHQSDVLQAVSEDLTPHLAATFRNSPGSDGYSPLWSAQG
jgi:medium-chain acyl-[acyl-carrier-protein] hydrolase